MTTLSYLAAEFPHLGVGSLVLGQSYRNPALLAKMAANLQMFSGGRFTLGLGAGWKEDEYRAYGYAYPSVKTRLGELEEAAIIIKQLWAGGPVTFEGTHYQVHNAYCQPRPEPAIPLLIGGGGEQKTLAIVARHADWWNFNSCSLDTYARKVALLKAHCQRIGRDFEEIRLTYLSTVSVSEQPDEVVRSAEKHFVAGNSEEVTRELEQFRELGVSYFIFRFLDPASLERFVQTVLPRFAGER
jgi:alkanesulfonate monooxygenase SsuD/methylene tetrahydromethanopterin reductase-like flavin-dependent oxidoreductase (luciferase family)